MYYIINKQSSWFNMHYNDTAVSQDTVILLYPSTSQIFICNLYQN